MSFLSTILKAVVKELKSFGKSKFKEKASELRESVEVFVIANSKDMERWLKLFSLGNITREEITWLMKSKRDLLSLEFLQLEGISLVEMEKARDEVIQLILKSALSLI